MLCGRKVGVTEQLLHGTQVGTTVEQVGGEGVAQRVGVGRRAGAAVEDAPDIARGEAVTTPVEEHRVGRGLAGDESDSRPSASQPPDGLDRRLAERDAALLAALAPHPDGGRVEVEVVEVEPAQLADPQTAAVEQLEHGVVAALERRVVVGGTSPGLVEQRR